MMFQPMPMRGASGSAFCSHEQAKPMMQLSPVSSGQAREAIAHQHDQEKGWDAGCWPDTRLAVWSGQRLTCVESVGAELPSQHELAATQAERSYLLCCEVAG